MEKNMQGFARAWFSAAAAVIWVSPFACPAQTPQETGRTIAEEAHRRYSGYGDSTAHLRMVLRNRQGQVSERELRVRTLETADGTQSLCIFDTPADVKQTILLTHTHGAEADNQWLYLPALKRVHRIAAQNKSGSFMGSEFSYEDIAAPVMEKYTHEWLRDESVDGRDCYVIEQRPMDRRNSGYVRQIAWLDKEEYRTLKVDYYDRKDSWLKTLTFKDYRKYLDRFWRPHDMNMVNHQTGKSSQLIWSDLAFHTGLTENDFNQANLTTIR
jgi:outer membrane lipoprotein-sorting protein